MHVRPAIPADVPEIVRLKEVLMRDGWPFDIETDAAWRDHAQQVAARLVTDPEHAWFVVDATTARDAAATSPAADAAADGAADAAQIAGGALAGCVSVGLTQHLPGPRGTGIVAYLGDMATDPAWRGRGIGTTLLERALAWATERGAGRVELYATEPGRPLYERYGFASGGPFEHMTRTLR